MANAYYYRPSLASLVISAAVRLVNLLLAVFGWLITPVVRLARAAWLFTIKATAPPWPPVTPSAPVDTGRVRSRAYEARCLARLTMPELSVGRGLQLAA